MAIRTLISTDGRSKVDKTFRILCMAFLVFLLVAVGTVACKKAEEGVSEEEGVALKESIIEFEGNVRVAVGKYIFIAEARGFDLVVQGGLESGDVSMLVGKEIRGEGEFTPERPSILGVNTIEIKDENGNWMNVFTRSEDIVLSDYLDLKARDEFPVLEKLTYDKKNDWEDKEIARVFGKLEGEEGNYKISVLDEKGKQVGKIIVDNFTDFGIYYVKKLRLFDKFWFYVDIKDTVDWNVRRRTREMFHADVLFAGLF